jgi:glyoxylase-like metal-dependent hydrolase (beta-lactamase superfamily II)
VNAEKIVPARNVSQIVPSLFSWEVFDPSIRTCLTSHAVLTPQGWWIVDPVPIDLNTLKSLFSKSVLLGILLTNENHERDSATLAENLSIPVYSHERVRDLFKRSPERSFSGGEILEGNVKVLHIPGATLGESVFFFSDLKLFIIGDALIHMKSTGFDFLPEKYCRDPEESRLSLSKLLDFDCKIMAFAHGEPLTREPKIKLQTLLSTFLQNQAS